jgi:hypothetical protein
VEKEAKVESQSKSLRWIHYGRMETYTFEEFQKYGLVF